MFRPYTPVSAFDQEDYFDVLFKVYTPNAEYPQGGKVSRFLESRKAGDTVEIAGPVGKIVYIGDGMFLKKCFFKEE